MGKAFIKFAAPSLTDHLVITWARFVDPTNYEGTPLSYAPPHPQRAATVLTNTNEMYQFKFWQSVDGSTLNTPLITLDVDCSVFSNSIDFYDYVVDRGSSGSDPAWADPEAGAVQIVDERLIGASSITLTRRGVGPLRPDEFTFDSATGTIDITASGETFYSQDTWFATVVTSVTQVGSGSSGGSGTPAPSIGGLTFMEISSDTTFGADHRNKILYWTGNALMGVITLPAFSTITGCRFRVVNHGGGANNRYVKLKFDGSEAVELMGESKNQLWLGVGEMIEIEVYNDQGYVVDYRGEYARLGELVWGRKGEKNRLDLIGTTYLKTEIERLYYDYIDKLPLSHIVTTTQWAQSVNVTSAGNTISVSPYKGFFAVSATQVILPDLRDRFVRALKLSGTDAQRYTDLPGGFQWDEVRSHTHSFNPGDQTGLSDNANDRNVKLPGSTTLTTSATGGTDTRPQNIGLIPQIII